MTWTTRFHLSVGTSVRLSSSHVTWNSRARAYKLSYIINTYTAHNDYIEFPEGVREGAVYYRAGCFNKWNMGGLCIIVTSCHRRCLSRSMADTLFCTSTFIFVISGGTHGQNDTACVMPVGANRSAKPALTIAPPAALALAPILQRTHIHAHMHVHTPYILCACAYTM